MKATLKIGDLAAATGAKVNTIRFYEDIGLMHRAARTPSGRRTYSELDVRRLRFIRHARELGFETGEIRSLLALTDNPQSDCTSANTIAAGHLESVERRIKQLLHLRIELQRMTRICPGGAASDCRILEAITGT